MRTRDAAGDRTLGFFARPRLFAISVNMVTCLLIARRIQIKGNQVTIVETTS